MPSLARGLVPFFLMTCAAMELKQDSLIVQVMDLARSDNCAGHADDAGVACQPRM